MYFYNYFLTNLIISPSNLKFLTLLFVTSSLQINAYGRLLRGDDDNEPIRTLCKAGDDLVVLPRRKVSPSNTGEKASPTPLETHPPVSLAQVNAAIKEENERLAAAGEPPPPIAPPTTAADHARAGAAANDRLQGSIRALVEGNFEQLRGYLEQLQEAVARQGIGGDEIMFGMPGDEEEEEDDDGMGEGEEDLDEDEEGDPTARGVAAVAAALGMGGMGGGGPVQIPQVEEAALAELSAMGFPDQLSRNALLLHRNRLQPAVDWALSHVDDPQGNEPLTEDVLAAVYGPQRRLGGGGGGAGAFMVARRPRLPPGQVDPGTLDSMVEMGFDRDQSARALAYTGNRLEDACQLIINGLPLPPLPEQQPQQPNPAAGGVPGEGGSGEAAAAGGGEGEGGNVDAADVAAALAGAVQAAAAPGAGEQGQGGEQEGMMDHDDDSHEDEEDEDWESDGGEDLGLESADIEHAMDLMFGGLGDGGAEGILPAGAVDWMAEEVWHSEDDRDYSEEEDEDEDDFEDEERFHDAGHAMNEGEEGRVPPAPSGAAAPLAQDAPPASQPQQPAPSSGNDGDAGGQKRIG